MSEESVPTVSVDSSIHHKSSLANEIGDQPALQRTASHVPVVIHIRYKTKTFPIECDLFDTLQELKDKIDKLTDVEPHVQKLVNKSITSVKRDDATTTLKDLNIIDGQTLLLVGATRSEISSTSGASLQSSATKEATDDQTATASKKEPLCKQTKHEKVLKAGKPDNVQAGIRNRNDPLPQSIDGLLMSMLNHSAKKARLTFKLELDELWINTAETTKKIPMTQIRNIVDESIEGQDGYSIVGFQTGPTENSIIWIYWCPSQYVKSIRREILSDH